MAPAWGAGVARVVPENLVAHVVMRTGPHTRSTVAPHSRAKCISHPAVSVVGSSGSSETSVHQNRPSKSKIPFRRICPKHPLLNARGIFSRHMYVVYVRGRDFRIT